MSFTQLHPDQKATSAVAHLKAAVAWYQSLGVTVRRVMTDNGSCYKAFAFRDACREPGLRQVRTRPCAPRTNGKAERFIQTMLREWAYGRRYRSSAERASILVRWIRHYNEDRPHASLNYLAPFSRRPPRCEQRS